jgi:hypothetical protein
MQHRAHKVRFSNIPAITWLMLAVTGCGVGLSEIEPSDTTAVNEQDPDYGNKVSAPSTVMPVVDLDANSDFIDIRGVGDSGWSGLRATQPPASGMGTTLKAFDPSQKILKGDLNFINWESGVGTRCNSYFNVDFAFMSRPEAIKEAFEHGFNLFGLANNHSEDCSSGVDPAGQAVPGAVATARFMKQFSNEKSMLWQGVGPRDVLSSPSILTFSLEGRSVKVIFGSITFQDWECVESTCEPRVSALLQNMKAASGDLRILSVHSQGSGPFQRGKAWSERFIREFSGDIVFASGPHTWAGVKAIPSNSGRTGVVFHGLGNFIHNQVSPNPDNLIGRVLLDKETLQAKQVQVIPILNNSRSVDVSLASPSKELPRSNLSWTRAILKAHRDVPVGFANLK